MPKPRNEPFYIGTASTIIDTIFGDIDTRNLTDEKYRNALTMGLEALIITKQIKLSDIIGEPSDPVNPVKGE